MLVELDTVHFNVIETKRESTGGELDTNADAMEHNVVGHNVPEVEVVHTDADCGRNNGLLRKHLVGISITELDGKELVGRVLHVSLEDGNGETVLSSTLIELIKILEEAVTVLLSTKVVGGVDAIANLVGEEGHIWRTANKHLHTFVELPEVGLKRCGLTGPNGLRLKAAITNKDGDILVGGGGGGGHGG